MGCSVCCPSSRSPTTSRRPPAPCPVLADAGLGGPVTLVTRAGEVYTEHTLRAGSGGERSRLELAAERDAAYERLAEVRVIVDSLREARGDRVRDLETARQRAKAALTTLREHDAALAAHAEQVNRVTVRHEAAIAECERLAAGLAQAQGAVADAEGAARAASAELNTALEAPRPMLDASARDEMLAALDAAREGEMRARLDVETLRERVRAGEARATGLERQREREREAAAQAARRAVIRRAQRDAAAGVVAELPHLLDSVDRSVAEARLALRTAESERSAVTAELTELRGQEAGMRERLAGLTESVHGLELQIHEKRLHVQRAARARRRRSSVSTKIFSFRNMDRIRRFLAMAPKRATGTRHPSPSIAACSSADCRTPSGSSANSAG